MSRLVFSADGGRTHLRGYLLNGQGETIGSKISSGLSPDQSDKSLLARNLCHLLEALLSQVSNRGSSPSTKSGIPQVDFAALGLAGFGRQEDCRELARLLEQAQPGIRWHVESDAEQTLRAAAPTGPVGIAILGTGSAFFARDESGRVHRTGGWGALLEDVGSGFEIARCGIQAFFRHVDGLEGQSSLFPALLRHASARNADEFRGFLYRQKFNPGDWADFASLALAEAEKGDPLCGGILLKQIQLVCQRLKALVSRSGIPAGTGIHFSGGLAKGNPSYFKQIKASMEYDLPDYPCFLLEKEPFWGGYCLYQSLKQAGEL